ncbi:Cytochrome b5, putative [Perkinsus marinus ATCC 50983]|uniref:Cytochrome b5, putative n=1 Tax=Perkinsus marinus (strain ATCC 50983 / TXsc) TaxID=423536 RepID=C5KRP1_PERM5|nr:Cytochrome b5, putative [Perkinsus marinus ATCC 50983]EER12852.1 Cytochrome b5, putative [Perkinsus marinus ATCC 50983]|eukprot:XP_002781057.1 Cytochrome b5, putative [Perkinsus marinus ATCC 50983]
MSEGYHSPTDAIRSRVITKAELAKHTTKHDAWISVHGLVLDVTKFKEDHPGGESILMRNAGTDCTEEYDDVDHSDEARMRLIREVAIGVLEGKEDTPGIPLEIKFGDYADNSWSVTQMILVTALVAGVAAGVMNLLKKSKFRAD